MSTIELYKFIRDHGIEWNEYNNDILMFVNIPQIDEFYQLLDATIFDDDGIECTMKDGYFCFEMDHICGYYGIELSEIFNNVTKE